MIVDALIQNDREVGYCEVTSDAGHDGFLLDPEIDRYGQLVHSFLDRLHGDIDLDAILQEETGDDSKQAWAATSIYHGSRLDIDMLLGLIDPDACVLDLGCGRGNLLAELKLRGDRRVLGVEVAEEYILASPQRPGCHRP